MLITSLVMTIHLKMVPNMQTNRFRSLEMLMKNVKNKKNSWRTTRVKEQTITTKVEESTNSPVRAMRTKNMSYLANLLTTSPMSKPQSIAKNSNFKPKSFKLTFNKKKSRKKKRLQRKQSRKNSTSSITNQNHRSLSSSRNTETASRFPGLNSLQQLVTSHLMTVSCLLTKHKSTGSTCARKEICNSLNLWSVHTLTR